ncbi:hypothetical protein Bbelb_119640 [Branchiostoma belcheri]|nr:hypothetical protein Bbelb_119640 [Branchiostoma belcheri]
MINTAGRELTLNIEGIPTTDHKTTANAIGLGPEPNALPLRHTTPHNKSLCAVTCSLEQLDLLGKLLTFLPEKPLEEIQPLDVYKEIGDKPKSRPPTTEELRPISLTPVLAKVVERFVASRLYSDNNIDPTKFGCPAEHGQTSLSVCRAPMAPGAHKETTSNDQDHTGKGLSEPTIPDSGAPARDQPGLPLDPARDPKAARPDCKSRSAPYRTSHGSRRETDRASEGP